MKRRKKPKPPTGYTATCRCGWAVFVATLGEAQAAEAAHPASCVVSKKIDGGTLTAEIIDEAARLMRDDYGKPK